MDQVMMQVAIAVRQRATCARLSVGCVITDVHRLQVLSFGYNGNVRGGPNECDSDEVGSCGCLHAEENALIKLTSPIDEMVMFTTTMPCLMCSKRIVNHGRIKLVYYDLAYRLRDGYELMEAAGIMVRRID